MPISILPSWMQFVAWGTPSYHFGQLALGAIGQQAQGDSAHHVAALVAITLVAAWLAVGGWRRSPA